MTAYETYRAIRKNMELTIAGKSDVIDLTIISLFCGGHILIEDVPGTGKTVLARSLAASIDGEYKRIQFTPDLLPSDVTGINYFNMKGQICCGFVSHRDNQGCRSVLKSFMGYSQGYTETLSSTSL